MSFDEYDDYVSLKWRDEADYSFSIKADDSSSIYLRRNESDENLATAKLTDFEGSDNHKLRFLYTAFHSKHQDALISAICLRPYKRDELYNDGLCGTFCIFNKECEEDVTCNKCWWSKGLKCK